MRTTTDTNKPGPAGREDFMDDSDIVFDRNVTLSVPPSHPPGLHAAWGHSQLPPLLASSHRHAIPVTDTDVKERCQETLQWLTTLPEGSIQIEVKGGWVTLTGNVRDGAEATAAEEVLRHIYGVQGVRNELQVEEA